MKITPNIEIIVSPLSQVETESLIKTAIAIVPIKKPATLSIKIDTNQAVQKLNKQFRNQNKPTNVLSFPDGQQHENGNTYLGDIIIASDVLKTEAKAENKKIEHHLQHLVIHGTLHLLGYDHVLEHEAEIMETHEINLLKKLKINNPYE